MTKSDVLGNQISEEAAINLLRNVPEAYFDFCALSPKDQHELLLFLTGQNTLTITYDPFFKKIFDPEAHSGRLESLISSILGQDVKVEKVLLSEGTRLSATGSFVIMDIVVRLKDNSIISVEIQKIGYKFPGERTSCYTSDLILRQYDTLKAEMGKKFSYRDMNPVHVIILMEHSSNEFRLVAPTYIHNKQVSYDSGAIVKELSQVHYISLDTFRERAHNKADTMLDAWLTFLSETDINAIINLINQYPQFLELYHEIANFRNNPKELLNMYSEALAIMDRNTELIMIEEARQEREEAKQQKEEAKQQKEEAKQQKEEAKQQKEEAKQQKEEAKQQKEEARQQLEWVKGEKIKLQQENDRIQRERKEFAQQLYDKDSQIANKDSRIAALEAQLAALQCTKE